MPYNNFDYVRGFFSKRLGSMTPSNKVDEASAFLLELLDKTLNDKDPRRDLQNNKDYIDAKLEKIIKEVDWSDFGIKSLHI